MQAPKNGFFYVLDRATGAAAFRRRIRHHHLGQGGGSENRPPHRRSPGARYGESGKPFVSMPGPGGAHSWQPMSFSPLTQLVYLPVTEAAFPFFPSANSPQRELGWNTGDEFTSGSLPQDPKIKAQIEGGLKGHLAAWDPVARKEVWRVELGHPWNGGVVVDRGQSRVPRHRNGRIRRLSRRHRRAPVVRRDAGRRARRDRYPMRSTASNTLRSKSAGAAPLVWLRASWRWYRTLPRTCRECWCSSWAASARRCRRWQQRPPRFSIRRPRCAARRRRCRQGALSHVTAPTCHGDNATGSGVLPDLRYSAVHQADAACDGGDRAPRQPLRIAAWWRSKIEITTGDLRENPRLYHSPRERGQAHRRHGGGARQATALSEPPMPTAAERRFSRCRRARADIRAASRCTWHEIPGRNESGC